MSKEGGGFQPGDYRRNSGRLEALALANEERRRNELLDFIRSNLDTHIYNSYKSSLEKGDFFRALRTIDEKIIPAITESERFTKKEEIAQAKDDLLHPIMLAAENGKYIAISALNARTLPPTKYINASEYEGRTQDRLMENRDLLEEIDQSIEERNVRGFEQARAILVSRVLEGKEPGKNQFKLMKDLEILSDRLSRTVRIQGVAAPAPRVPNEKIIDLVSETENSITDLVSETARAQLIDPKKYEKNLKDALNRHHDLLGRLNLAIADKNVDGIKEFAQKLNNKLKETLTSEERSKLKDDITLTYKNIRDLSPPAKLHAANLQIDTSETILEASQRPSNFIYSDQYEGELEAALSKNKILLDEVNHAILKKSTKEIARCGGNLIKELKRTLSKEQVQPVIDSLVAIHGKIRDSNPRIPETVAAQARAAISASIHSSPPNESSELDSPTKRMRINDKGDSNRGSSL